jgi:hypothetical protein
MRAQRMRPGGVEMRNQLRFFGCTDVENIKARGFAPRRLLEVVGIIRVAGAAAHLVTHHHHVADHFQRIGAHLRVRQFRLHHHFEIARIGDIHTGEIFRCGLVCQPQDAPPVAGQLHIAAFADAAEAVEFVLRQQLHVQCQRA